MGEKGVGKMISEKLLAKLNEQITHEFDAGNIYLSMAAYCAEKGYPGFSHFYIEQAKEERYHAMKIFDFVNELGERAVISGLPNPEQDFGSIRGTVEAALEHEKKVTGLINELVDLAFAEKHYPSLSMLQWFVDEQVEEEDSFRSILDRLDLIGDAGGGMYQLDRELGKREFSED